MTDALAGWAGEPISRACDRIPARAPRPASTSSSHADSCAADQPRTITHTKGCKKNSDRATSSSQFQAKSCRRRCASSCPAISVSSAGLKVCSAKRGKRMVGRRTPTIAGPDAPRDAQPRQAAHPSRRACARHIERNEPPRGRRLKPTQRRAAFHSPMARTAEHSRPQSHKQASSSLALEKPLDDTTAALCSNPISGRDGWRSAPVTAARGEIWDASEACRLGRQHRQVHRRGPYQPQQELDARQSPHPAHDARG